MKNIRRGIFETNSSSTHSICICTAEEYDKFIHGQFYYDILGDELVEKEKVEKERLTKGDYFDEERFQTSEGLNHYWDGLDRYKTRYTTPSGDNIVVFGAYGYDG